MSAGDAAPFYPEEVASSIAEALDMVTTPLAARIAALEHENAELRSALSLLADKSLAYGGLWRASARYARNTIVTDKSSLWVCVKDHTQVRPGTGPSWTLIQKANRFRLPKRTPIAKAKPR